MGGVRPKAAAPLNPELVAKLCQQAQVDSERAYRTVIDLMENAGRDSVRLEAALKILAMAGVPMTPEVTVTVNQPTAQPPQGMSAEALMEGLCPAEALA